MPSQARRSFDALSSDIEKLLSYDLVGPRGGKSTEKSEVLNKSAIVLLTAFWEAYCEDLAIEGVEHLIAFTSEPSDLPKRIRQLVASELRETPHELAMWQLAGDGWKKLLRERLDVFRDASNLNTPNSKHVEDLFEKYIGMPGLSHHWKWPGMTAEKARTKLDQLVSLRGDIAHRGAASQPVSRSTTKSYLDHVRRLVGRTGGSVNTFLRAQTGTGLWEPMLVRVTENITGRSFTAAEVQRVVDAMNPTEQEVIRLRFGLGQRGLSMTEIDKSEHLMTLREIAKLFGLSSERVRQIEARALGKLRSAHENRLE